MSRESLLKLIQSIDELISNHEIQAARSHLANLRIDEVPGDFAAQFAQLCRRAGFSGLALKVLNRVIHDSRAATENDWLEYASTLRKLGLLEECHRTLEAIRGHSEYHLHKGFCFISQWQYAEAAQEFEKYLEQERGSRQTTIAKVNLASSYIHIEKYELAERILRETSEASAEKYHHLWINSKELQAQLYFQMRDLSQTRRVLEEAEPASSHQPGLSQLLLELWRALLELMDGNRARLDDFRRRARQEEAWEALRSADWEATKAHGDAELFAKVFFGSPYPGFRELLARSELFSQLPETYQFKDGRYQGSSIFQIDPLNGLHMPCKYGSLQYRGALVLLSDLYRPWTVGRAFNALFPDEKFDPYTSPKRIYQILERIRSDIIKRDLPLELVSSGKGFRLRPRQEASVSLHRRMILNSAEDLVGEFVKEEYRDGQFTLSELCEVLPLSVDQTGRILRKLSGQGVLESSNGKPIRYHLKAA